METRRSAAQKKSPAAVSSEKSSVEGSGSDSAKEDKRVDKGQKLFSCTDCGKSFRLRNSFLKHIRIHTHGKPYTCRECGKGFSSSFYRSQHEKIHTGEKPFSCNVCGKSFRFVSDLSSHRKMHVAQKPFCCGECGQCFTTNYYLLQHKVEHTGEKPFSCSDCDKAFLKHSHLVQHKRKHTGEKPYTCSDCGRSFSVKDTLVKHARTHTGEKPFPCSICDKRFTTSYYRSQHEKAHAVQKTYPCADCDESFTKFIDLLNHKTQQHTGDRTGALPKRKQNLKPFFCGVCGMLFTQRSHLMTHQMVHAPKNPSHIDDLFQQQSTLEGEEISRVNDRLSSDMPQIWQKSESKSNISYAGIGPNESFANVVVKKEFDPTEELLVNEEANLLEVLIKEEIDRPEEEIDPLKI